MGHIKEPKGVDFVIKSEPLTDKARQEISEFIRNYKKGKIGKKANQATAVKKAKLIQV
jgi:uncharacterized protein YbcI